MLENLRTFIFREAGDSGADRLALLCFLAPSLHIADGYDFNGLSELSRNAYGHHFVGGHNEEYVASPGGRASDLLRCIAVRPYNRNGYEDTPYVLVEQAARHLRDVLNDAADPDFDNLIRHIYIEPDHAADWRGAAGRWKQSSASGGLQGAPDRQSESPEQRCARLLQWLEEEESVKERGALARVVRRDGRARQTVSADIDRAKQRRREGENPIARMARTL